MAEDLSQSKRFQTPEPRRDFLGLAAAWSAVSAVVMAILGAMRLPMPSVFPESSSKVKLGRPEDFPVGTQAYFARPRLWLFRDPDGFHALSSVCTHLGCIVKREGEGDFVCPCHGSKFTEDGAVRGGPAPKGLVWVELGLSPEGQLTADTLKQVSPGTFFQV